MLVLTRKIGETILIGDNIKIQLIEVSKDSVKIGISAPKDITVLRGEILNEIIDQNIKSSKTSKEQGQAIDKILQSPPKSD